MPRTQKKCLVKKILLACLTLACFSLAACAKEGDAPVLSGAKSRDAIESEELQFATPEQGDTIAVFTTDLGEWSVLLYPSLAPQACENFITLTNEGFYDGTPIDRIVNGFCVQGGLNAEGQSSSAWDGNPFPMEVSDNLHHYAGALCAAPNEDGNAASPFYIVQAMPKDVSDAMVSAMQEADYREAVISAYTDAGGVPYLDYTDTVFGQVYEGMKTIDTIAALETDETDTPLEEILITSVTITTYQG